MDDDSGTGVPASIEAAWGLRERPLKGPKPGLSLDRIVAAGVKVATSDGIAAVSMSRVATVLGASAMSLYRYVAAKDELLALMVDAAIGTPPPPAEEAEGWRAGLSRWANGFRAVLYRHPWIVRVPITAPPTTPNQVTWLEDGLRSMHGTGLTEGEKMSTILVLSGFIRNEATVTTDLRESSGPMAHEGTAAWARSLSRLTDAERFPALHAVLASGVLDEADDPDPEYSFGLERILDGVEALVRSRSPS
jgi:AcrR family transcriptional regulator